MIRLAIVDADFRRRLEPDDIVAVLRAMAADTKSSERQFGGEVARPD
jgi:hypothetical protein